MSAYEFWDELGNIFNAIVAYQEKTIEFNKQFVNPWIRLGTVLDQNDNNAETLAAHKKAIAIDKDNATNWLALGDVYFKMGSFEEASASYAKAIELNPKLGWAYANLALTHATRQKYTEAINMYVKSLELITDEKDRAMIWNRLGNVYRKVNDYENAFIAFQMADECDGQNTGFEDKLDDVAVEQKGMHMVAEVYVNNNPPHVSEEPLAVTTEDAQPTEIAEANEPMETLEQEITYTQVEESLSETADDEVPASLDETGETALLEDATAVEETEISELELVAEQSLDVEEVPVDVTEVPSAAEQETERLELDELIRTIITKHSAEEPQIAEGSEQSAATLTNAEVTQPVVEDVTVTDDSAEIAEETPVLETVNNDTQAENDAVSAPKAELVIEDNQLEVIVESSVSEIVSEESQAEAAAETSTEEPVEVIEPAVMADVPAQETIAQEAPVMEETPAPESANIDVSASTTMTPVMTHDAGTFANPLELNQPVVLVVEDLAELIEKVTAIAEAEVESTPVETETQPEVQVGVNAIVEEVVAQAEQSESGVVELPVVEEVQPEAAVVTEEVVLENEHPEAVEAIVEERVQSAYDEFLKNAAEPTVVIAEEPDEVMAHEASFLNSNTKSDLKVEPDTKNAHVWNELGNVYFNTGSYEEAVTAYSKAIELDDWFAWPYSNLALVYVQKEKYAEAVLLYQRSIELFASDKDKAVTWNRLGNVYRRLNDYDNAIACYQRADELDPNNATLSQRLRFSLLGSLNIETSQSLAV